MTLNPVFDPAKMGRPMRVAAFMSGSGTNIRRLLEHETSLGKKANRPLLRRFLFSATGRTEPRQVKKLLWITVCLISAMTSGFFMPESLSNERWQTRKVLQPGGNMTVWPKRWWKRFTLMSSPLAAI